MDNDRNLSSQSCCTFIIIFFKSFPFLSAFYSLSLFILLFANCKYIFLRCLNVTFTHFGENKIYCVIFAASALVFEWYSKPSFLPI